MISAVPAGDVHDLLLWLLIAVVASIDMIARAIEMGQRAASGPSARQRLPPGGWSVRSPRRHRGYPRPDRGHHHCAGRGPHEVKSGGR